MWDPADYGGITVIRILSENVWKPDIVLFNKLVYCSLPLQLSLWPKERDVLLDYLAIYLFLFKRLRAF